MFRHAIMRDLSFCDAEAPMDQEPCGRPAIQWIRCTSSNVTLVSCDSCRIKLPFSDYYEISLEEALILSVMEL